MQMLSLDYLDIVTKVSEKIVDIGVPNFWVSLDILIFEGCPFLQMTLTQSTNFETSIANWQLA